jgi:putative ABC transport system permease protein
MFLTDLRYAVRGFLRQPGFSLAALLTLALGIGANVAVFAVFEAVMLRPLGYSDAEELAVLNHRDRGTGITKQFLVLGDYVDMTGRLTSFERLSAYGSGQATIIEPEGAQRVGVLFAGAGLLDLLRVHPAQGRALTADDHREGSANVVILGHEFWQRHYGGRPMLGTSISVGGNALQVVGIAPPGFRFPANSSSDLIVPMSVPATVPAVRRSGWTMAVGRLKPGVSLQRANDEIRQVSHTMEREFPATNHDTEYFLASLRDTVAGPTRPALFLLLASVAVVLLIACANVANLLLVRSLGREREFAISQALGAGRKRLISRMLAESVVIAVAAVVVGVVGARWGTGALVRLIPGAEDLPALAHVGLNPAVLAFAIGAGVLAALISGAQSIFTIGRTNLAAELVGSRGASLGRGGPPGRTPLIVCEFAHANLVLIFPAHT